MDQCALNNSNTMKPFFIDINTTPTVYGDLRLQFTANRVLAGGTGKYQDRLCGPVPPVWNIWLEMALNTPWRLSSIVSLLLPFLMITSTSQNLSFCFPYLIKTTWRNIKWRHILFYLIIQLISIFKIRHFNFQMSQTFAPQSLWYSFNLPSYIIAVKLQISSPSLSLSSTISSSITSSASLATLISPISGNYLQPPGPICFSSNF